MFTNVSRHRKIMRYNSQKILESVRQPPHHHIVVPKLNGSAITPFRQEVDK